MLINSHNFNDDRSPDISKEKIDRHLRDINDTISEEDINNIGKGSVTENKMIINNGIIELPDEDEDQDEERVKEDDQKNVPTPWNIIN